MALKVFTPLEHVILRKQRLSERHNLEPVELSHALLGEKGLPFFVTEKKTAPFLVTEVVHLCFVSLMCMEKWI